jgi:hypothetical protein
VIAIFTGRGDAYGGLPWIVWTIYFAWIAARGFQERRRRRNARRTASNS